MLDASWMALGAILAGFWPQLGGQDEAKLAPKSNIIGYQIEYQKKDANRMAKERLQEALATIGTTILGPRGGIKGRVNPSLEGLKQCWNVGKGQEATSIPPVAQVLVGLQEVACYAERDLCASNSQRSWL